MRRVDMKRITILTLIACVAIGLFGTVAFGESALFRENIEGEEYVDGYYTYKIVDGEAILTECDGDQAAGDITAPAELGGYPVTAIGDNAFYNCTGITSVTIPDSVVNIGMRAFERCQNIAAIEFGNGVENIGEFAFNKCGIKTLIVPQGVTTISLAAFSDCYNLTEVVFHDGVTRIEEYAFSGCRSLKEVDLPSSLEYIGFMAFSYSPLETIEIPNTIKRIDREDRRKRV